jgi:hypothetical protein
MSVTFNLLVKLLPAKEASQVTIRATRKVLSAMWHMVVADAGTQVSMSRGFSSRSSRRRSPA